MIKKCWQVFSFLLIVIIPCKSFGQCQMCAVVIDKDEVESQDRCMSDLGMFKHYTIVEKEDTVRFHFYSNEPLEKIENVLLYIQGSGGNPIYQIEHMDDGLFINSQVPISTKSIPEHYALLLVSKPHTPFCVDSMNYNPTLSFYQSESLNKRVFDSDLALRYVLDNLILKPKKILAVGHSEGSDVVAKLGTVNVRITHFGYLSGGGHSQWYDFPLMISKSVSQGEISVLDGIAQVDSLFEQYRDIIKSNTSIEKTWEGNTYKRWHSFSEPPIENLIKINKPIFMAIGSNDRSVPLESAYLIPVEFIRREKDNLTFKVYAGLSHNFIKTQDNGKREQHWEKVFTDFINWVEKN